MIFEVTVRQNAKNISLFLVDANDMLDALKITEKYLDQHGDFGFIESLKRLSASMISRDDERICLNCQHWKHIHPETGCNYSRGICSRLNYEYIKDDKYKDSLYHLPVYIRLGELVENHPYRFFTKSNFGCSEFKFKKEDKQ